MRIHLGKKDHKCPHCDYSSVRKDNLKSHMKTHDKNNKQSTTRKRITPTSDLPTYLNHQRFSSPVFKNSDKNRNSFYNRVKFHNSLEHNYAPNSFYPPINSSFKDIPRPYTFLYDQLAPVIKRRRFEEQLDNKSSAKTTEITEQRTRVEIDQNVENKSMSTQQKTSPAIEKGSKKINYLFRPYEDIVGKNC